MSGLVGDLRQGFHPVLAKRESYFVVPYLLPELLPDEHFQIRFIIDHDILCDIAHPSGVVTNDIDETCQEKFSMSFS